MLTKIGELLGLGFVLLVLWVPSGCKPTKENYWVVTFELPSWLKMCIPIHIENIMKEDAFILHLSLVVECV